MKLSDLINEKRRAEERKRKVDTFKKLAIGSAIGALAGILFAPKSGKEFRKDISDKTKETAEATKKTMKDLEGKVKEEIKNKINEVKERKMFEIEMDNDIPENNNDVEHEKIEEENTDDEVAGE